MSRVVSATNTTRDTSLGTSVRVADGWWTRLRGLLGAPTLADGEGLVLIPCRAVHMYGMKQALDVVFTDRDGTVIALYPGLAPGQRTRVHKDSHSVFEVPPGTIEKTETELGDRIRTEPV
jgi:uncharacterized membrane protein (UPF0127 family)